MVNKKPSKEYIKNINYYKKMHLEGYALIDGRKRNPVDAYNGKSTLIYAKLIKEIIGKAKKYVFINIACHPAIALLTNKKNAHINVNTPQWWHQKILNSKKNLNKIKIICICSIKENDMIKYFPLQYDDKLTNYETK